VKAQKIKICWCMEDCRHHGEGFVIRYNDDETVVYLCETHFNELTKSINDLKHVVKEM
jgi:hypothetical protein